MQNKPVSNSKAIGGIGIAFILALLVGGFLAYNWYCGECVFSMGGGVPEATVSKTAGSSGGGILAGSSIPLLLIIIVIFWIVKRNRDKKKEVAVEKEPEVVAPQPEAPKEEPTVPPAEKGPAPIPAKKLSKEEKWDQQIVKGLKKALEEVKGAISKKGVIATELATAENTLLGVKADIPRLHNKNLQQTYLNKYNDLETKLQNRKNTLPPAPSGSPQFAPIKPISLSKDMQPQLTSKGQEEEAQQKKVQEFEKLLNKTTESIETSCKELRTLLADNNISDAKRAFTRLDFNWDPSGWDSKKYEEYSRRTTPSLLLLDTIVEKFLELGNTDLERKELEKLGSKADVIADEMSKKLKQFRKQITDAEKKQNKIGHTKNGPTSSRIATKEAEEEQKRAKQQSKKQKLIRDAKQKLSQKLSDIKESREKARDEINQLLGKAVQKARSSEFKDADSFLSQAEHKRNELKADQGRLIKELRGLVGQPPFNVAQSSKFLDQVKAELTRKLSLINDQIMSAGTITGESKQEHEQVLAEIKKQTAAAKDYLKKAEAAVKSGNLDDASVFLQNARDKCLTLKTIPPTLSVTSKLRAEYNTTYEDLTEKCHEISLEIEESKREIAVAETEAANRSFDAAQKARDGILNALDTTQAGLDKQKLGTGISNASNLASHLGIKPSQKSNKQERAQIFKQDKETLENIIARVREINQLLSDAAVSKEPIPLNNLLRELDTLQDQSDELLSHKVSPALDKRIDKCSSHLEKLRKRLAAYTKVH